MGNTRFLVSFLVLLNVARQESVRHKPEERTKMNKREVDYHISNGEFAVKYLHELSIKSTGREECNKAFNHALAVEQMVRIAKHCYILYEGLRTENEQLKKTINDLKSGEFNELLETEKAKLKQEFENMKKSLITLIHDFPDIDY